MTAWLASERSREMAETALTALFYHGTLAAKCRELTNCDTGGRFRMSSPFKNGTFYDGNSALTATAGDGSHR